VCVLLLSFWVKSVSDYFVRDSVSLMNELIFRRALSVSRRRGTVPGEAHPPPSSPGGRAHLPAARTLATALIHRGQGLAQPSASGIPPHGLAVACGTWYLCVGVWVCVV